MVFPSFLAFDLGAESGRAILGRLETNRLYTKEIYRFSNAMLPIHGHLYWDFHRLLEEIKTGLAACAEVSQIGSFGIDTWGVDFGLLDKQGSMIGMPLAYRDPHTKDAMEGFFRLIPQRRVYQLTGIQFLPFNSLFQLYAMKRDKSSTLGRAHDLLFMPDLFHYYLTGEKKTEFTYATTSQLYNPEKEDWEKELFDALGISASLMQEIVEPGTRFGNLDSKISQHLGWKDVPVIAVATHDTASAVVSIPAKGKDWAFISSGTWSLMGVETDRPIINDLAFRHNFTNEGGVECTFRFLKNVAGLWLLQKCRERWETEKECSYNKLTLMAQQAKSFPFFIDPDWEGFLNPSDMPEAIQRYCARTHQKSPRSSAAFVRGIFESLALKYRIILDEIRQVSSSPIDKIHIIGGGAKNRLLCQFTANATELPVYSGPAEATSIGNIMMQSMAQGCIESLGQIREIIHHSFDIAVYEPMHRDEWREALGLFRKIIQMEVADEQCPKG